MLFFDQFYYSIIIILLFTNYYIIIAREKSLYLLPRIMRGSTFWAKRLYGRRFALLATKNAIFPPFSPLFPPWKKTRWNFAAFFGNPWEKIQQNQKRWVNQIFENALRFVFLYSKNAKKWKCVRRIFRKKTRNQVKKYFSPDENKKRRIFFSIIIPFTIFKFIIIQNYRCWFFPCGANEI